MLGHYLKLSMYYLFMFLVFYLFLKMLGIETNKKRVALNGTPTDYIYRKQWFLFHIFSSYKLFSYKCLVFCNVF